MECVVKNSLVGAHSDMAGVEDLDETLPKDEYVPGKSLSPSLLLQYNIVGHPCKNGFVGIPCCVCDMGPNLLFADCSAACLLADCLWLDCLRLVTYFQKPRESLNPTCLID
jgi:hypothetical protein